MAYFVNDEEGVVMGSNDQIPEILCYFPSAFIHDLLNDSGMCLLF